MYKTIRYSKMENILSCLLRDYHKDINSGSFCDDLYKFNNIFMSIIETTIEINKRTRILFNLLVQLINQRENTQFILKSSKS